MSAHPVINKEEEQEEQVVVIVEEKATAHNGPVCCVLEVICVCTELGQGGEKGR